MLYSIQIERVWIDAQFPDFGRQRLDIGQREFDSTVTVAVQMQGRGPMRGTWHPSHQVFTTSCCLM
jgi:hypothetical protein